jgi:Zn-dependent peptidase ImmA (M78 family)/transcriptional regulator with XRE-family HTH domain
VDAIQIGRRLKLAREARELSQQAAAEAIGVPRTAITQIEAGNRSVSTLELARLASLYARPVNHFFEEMNDVEAEDVLVALYRAAPGLEHDAGMRRHVDHCLRLCQEGVLLEGVLGFPPRSGPPVYDVRTPRSGGEAVAQGEEVAEKERRRLAIGSTPISDVSELIGTQGVWASGTVLPDDVSGMFLQHPSIGLAIIVNAGHSRGRKRFSYAHEYAHALLDRTRNVTVSSTGNSGELVEKRANAFAAAFLMPREGIFEALRGLDKGLPSRHETTIFDAASGGHIDAEFRTPPGSQRITYKDVAHVARRFGVSYQAALFRLKSLRHISQQAVEDLLRREDAGRSYLRALDMYGDLEDPEEKKYWDRELRSEVAHLAIEAYRRGEISRGRLLEISKSLRISGQVLVDLAEAARED